MGEAVKNKINLDEKKRSLKRRRKVVAYQHDHDRSIPQCKIKRNPKPQIVVKPKGTLYSLSDLTKTIHILREVLLGKLSRDMMYSRSLDECSLPEMLRFYCETSFGVTSISDCRQTDLFNAILALQRASPFLRTTKRLLNIPGIETYSDDIALIYYQMWTWLMTNDVIVDFKCQVQSQDLLAVDDDSKLKRLLVTMESFFDCLSSIKKEHDHSFPGGFLGNLEDKISNLEFYDLDQGATQNENEHWFDIDDMLEVMLNYLEDLDDEMKDVDNDLFGSLVTRNKIIAPSSSMKNAVVLHDDSSFHHLLRKIKTLLDLCIIEDENRDGLIQYMHFRRLLQEWFITCNEKAQFDRNEFKQLFDLLQSDDDSVAKANYVYFVGVLYTIFIDEQILPSMKDMLLYFSGFGRGIEAHHFELLNDYVANVRLKRKVTRHHDPPTLSEANVEYVGDESSRQTMKKSKMTTHDSTTDFLAKWLTTGSLRNEYRNNIVESLNAAHEMNIRSPLKKLKGTRPKTPIHIVELQGDFDSEMSEIFECLDAEYKTIDDNHQYHLHKEILGSEIKPFKEDLEKRMSAHKDHSARPSSCTSVLFPFEEELAFNTFQVYDESGRRSHPSRPPSQKGDYPSNPRNNAEQNIIESDNFPHPESKEMRVDGFSQSENDHLHSSPIDGVPQSENDDQEQLKPASRESLTETLLDNVMDYPSTVGKVDGFGMFNSVDVQSTSKSTLRTTSAPSIFKSLVYDRTRIDFSSHDEDGTNLAHKIYPTISSDMGDIGAPMRSSEMEVKTLEQDHDETKIDQFDMVAQDATASSIKYGPMHISSSHNTAYDDRMIKVVSTIAEPPFPTAAETLMLHNNTCSIRANHPMSPSSQFLDERITPLSLLHPILLPTISPMQARKVAEESSWKKLLQLERTVDLTNYQMIKSFQVTHLLPPHAFLQEEFFETVYIPNLPIVIQNGRFNRQTTKSSTLAAPKQYTLSRLIPKHKNLHEKDSSLVPIEYHNISLISTDSKKDVVDLSCNIDAHQIVNTNPDQNILSQSAYTDEPNQLDMINFLLLDRWQWQSLFEDNENLLLSILCKFHSHHRDLQLARCRHRLDKDELKNVATFISTLRRLQRNNQLEEDAISWPEETRPSSSSSTSSWRKNAHSPNTLGVGIKSLLLTAKRRKANNLQPMSNQSKSTIYKSHVYGQRIQIIHYRIAK